VEIVSVHFLNYKVEFAKSRYRQKLTVAKWYMIYKLALKCGISSNKIVIDGCHTTHNTQQLFYGH